MGPYDDSLLFQRADWTDQRVVDLLNFHAVYVSSPKVNLPGEKSYGLDATALQRPDITMFTAHDKHVGQLLAVAALRVLPPSDFPSLDKYGLAEQPRYHERVGELKSMHTVAAARGRGVGERLLLYLSDEARRAGLAKLYLETGSTEDFAPARRCYQKTGFVRCGAFGKYDEQANSVFMVKQL